jgi:hypothetical protein
MVGNFIDTICVHVRAEGSADYLSEGKDLRQPAF